MNRHQIAIHEAGHAVAALDLGIPIPGIEVQPSRIGECAFAAACPDPEKRLDILIAGSVAMSLESDDAAEQALATLLKHRNAADVKRAVATACLIDSARPQVPLHAAVRRAERSLSRHWPLALAIAARLEQCARVTASEIATLRFLYIGGLRRSPALFPAHRIYQVDIG